MRCYLVSLDAHWVEKALNQTLLINNTPVIIYLKYNVARSQKEASGKGVTAEWSVTGLSGGFVAFRWLCWRQSASCFSSAIFFSSRIFCPAIIASPTVAPCWDKNSKPSRPFALKAICSSFVSFWTAFSTALRLLGDIISSFGLSQPDRTSVSDVVINIFFNILINLKWSWEIIKLSQTLKLLPCEEGQYRVNSNCMSIHNLN